MADRAAFEAWAKGPHEVMPNWWDVWQEAARQEREKMAALPMPKSIVNAFVGKDRAAWEHGFHTGCRMMKERLGAVPPPLTSYAGTEGDAVSIELLPCPFCGGSDIRIHDHGNIGTGPFHRGQRVYTLGCYGCGANNGGGMYEEHGRKMLIEKWNSRAQPSEPETTLAHRIAELVEQHGSLRAAARVLESDAGYLSRLATGEKADPGETLLRRMGLRQIITYERR